MFFRMRLFGVILLLGLISQIAFAAGTLMIGDSHSVGPFGDEMSRQLEATEGGFVRVGVAGSSVRHYLSSDVKVRTLKYGSVYQVRGAVERVGHTQNTVTPRMDDLLEKYHPKRVIVALGENMVNYSSGVINEKALVKEIEPLLKTLEKNQAECFWFLPTWTDQENRAPYFKKNETVRQFNQTMKSILGNRCQVISGTELESWTIDKVRTVKGDWLHHSESSGKGWAQAVLKYLGFKDKDKDKDKDKGKDKEKDNKDRDRDRDKHRDMDMDRGNYSREERASVVKPQLMIESSGQK